MYDRLEEIWTVSDAHGESFILIGSNGCTDSNKFLLMTINFESTKSHGDVNLFLLMVKVHLRCQHWPYF